MVTVDDDDADVFPLAEGEDVDEAFSMVVVGDRLNVRVDNGDIETLGERLVVELVDTVRVPETEGKPLLLLEMNALCDSLGDGVPEKETEELIDSLDEPEGEGDTLAE